MRGRGGRSINRLPLRGPYKPLKPHISIKPPFDLALCEKIFPRATLFDDQALQIALEKRIVDLSPSEAELASLNVMVIEVQKVFDALIATPSNFSGCQIDECKLVGSLKKGTIFTGHLVADMVVVLQTLPFQKSIEVLASRVLGDLKNLKSLPDIETYIYQLNESGFFIAGPVGSIRVRIATVISNYSKLDPQVHLSLKVLETHAAAIKHVKWFEDNVNNDKVKNMVKLLKDLKNRFDGLALLNPWMIDLLAYQVVMNNPKKEPATESAAYRRALRLLAAGLFLVGSTGVTDPCDGNNKWLHVSLTHEQQDVLCFTAQHLVRILAHGGCIPLLNGNSTLLTNPSMWNGVVVHPCAKAYEKPPEKEVVQSEDMNMSVEETCAA